MDAMLVFLSLAFFGSVCMHGLKNECIVCLKSIISFKKWYVKWAQFGIAIYIK